MQWWENACNLVIRPERHIYSESDLGDKVFAVDVSGHLYKRSDYALQNERKLKIVASHFEPVVRSQERLPCVIYCHGNCGSRMVAKNVINLLLPYQITVFCFDFTGSGLSEGQYVSLGYFEHKDLSVCVQFLRDRGTTSTIGLWGRSMGGVSSLLYSALDPSIAAMVLDSPFADLRQLMEELVLNYSDSIPTFLARGAISLLSSSIQDRAGFDISEVSPQTVAASCFVPCIIAHGVDDSLVPVKHAHQLYEAYAGDKKLMLLQSQSHNSLRPEYFDTSCTIFLINHLNNSQLQYFKGIPPIPDSKIGAFSDAKSVAGGVVESGTAGFAAKAVTGSVPGKTSSIDANLTSSLAIFNQANADDSDDSDQDGLVTARIADPDLHPSDRSPAQSTSNVSDSNVRPVISGGDLPNDRKRRGSHSMDVLKASDKPERLSSASGWIPCLQEVPAVTAHVVPQCEREPNPQLAAPPPRAPPDPYTMFSLRGDLLRARRMSNSAAQRQYDLDLQTALKLSMQDAPTPN
jgi:cephalosporin-C deacetylase-like acetyl esterase